MNRSLAPVWAGFHRILIGACIVVGVCACSQTDDTPPPAIVSALTGQWKQTDGSGTAQFYPDTTVKLMFPDHKPPIQLLTSYDMLKGKIGIDSGGYLTGPIMLDLDLAHRRIVMSLPGASPVTLVKQSQP